MDPTTIAPNCWDADTCNALATSSFDDNFDIFHTTPYTYVADAAYGISNNNNNNLTISPEASPSLAEFVDAYLSDDNSSDGPACPANYPACGLQTTIIQGDNSCDQCKTNFRWEIQNICCEIHGLAALFSLTTEIFADTRWI